MHQVRFRLLLTFVFLKKHDINFRNIVWKYEKNVTRGIIQVSNCFFSLSFIDKKYSWVSLIVYCFCQWHFVRYKFQNSIFIFSKLIFQFVDKIMFFQAV